MIALNGTQSVKLLATGIVSVITRCTDTHNLKLMSILIFKRINMADTYNLCLLSFGILA